MAKLKVVLAWVGVVLLGLITGILEDIMFISLLVPYLPASWDVTGDLFFPVIVPMAQLLALAITGTAVWFLGARHQLSKLVTFWVCWSVGRTAFLVFANNPPADIAIYLVWIAVWCALLGLLARSRGSQQPA